MKSLFMTIVLLSVSFVLPAQTNYVAQTANSATPGTGNTIVGPLAGNTTLTGEYNAFFGYQAGNDNTTGDYNAFLGAFAGGANKTGFYNAFVGYIAGRQNTTGHSNAFFGYGAGYSNSSGFSNTMLGHRAGRGNISGDYNVMVGDSAGFNCLGSRNLFLGNRAGFYETGSNKLYLASDSNRTIMYGDLLTGKVLLGKRQPHGYVFPGDRTLYVLGGVLADSVRVSLSSNWSDYVFDESYKLPTLEEVERFIKTNKHLPGIPTASEVKENGIELASMNAKLLAKIEELTLYVLQLKKEIDGLKKKR